MGYNFDLNSHIVFTKPREPKASLNWLVVRHPLLEVSCHCCKRFVVQRHMVRVHAEDLRPALAASVSEAVVDVLECLIDLSIDLGVEVSGVPIPST